jgi:hypothetical protein
VVVSVVASSSPNENRPLSGPAGGASLTGLGGDVATGRVVVCVVRREKIASRSDSAPAPVPIRVSTLEGAGCENVAGEETLETGFAGSIL